MNTPHPVWHDPIVAEIHAMRERLASQFQNDLAAAHWASRSPRTRAFVAKRTMPPLHMSIPDSIGSKDSTHGFPFPSDPPSGGLPDRGSPAALFERGSQGGTTRRGGSEFSGRPGWLSGAREAAGRGRRGAFL